MNTETFISTNVEGLFLIAMPGLADPLFNSSLIYMIEHNKDGAIGLIINKPLDIKLHEVLNQIDNNSHACHVAKTVLQGGPVDSSRGFVLHTLGNPLWQNQIELSADLFMTTSQDILEALINGEDIGRFHLVLGYSGWDAGQLEQEIMNNDWLPVPVDQDILFNTDEKKQLKAAAAKAGIHYDALSNVSGHA